MYAPLPGTGILPSSRQWKKSYGLSIHSTGKGGGVNRGVTYWQEERIKEYYSRAGQPFCPGCGIGQADPVFRTGRQGKHECLDPDDPKLSP